MRTFLYTLSLIFVMNGCKYPINANSDFTEGNYYIINKNDTSFLWGNKELNATLTFLHFTATDTANNTNIKISKNLYQLRQDEKILACISGTFYNPTNFSVKEPADPQKRQAKIIISTNEIKYDMVPAETTYHKIEVPTKEKSNKQFFTQPSTIINKHQILNCIYFDNSFEYRVTIILQSDDAIKDISYYLSL